MRSPISLFLRRKSVFVCFLTISFTCLAYISLIYALKLKLNIATIWTPHKDMISRLTFNTEAGTVEEPRPIVQLFNASTESKSLQKSVLTHQCVRFVTPGKASKICVYPAAIDIHVSGSLIRGGTWESDLLFVLKSYLQMNPDMVLLDLGCNIGVFTIYAAKLGHEVVSVDANKFNLMLLSRSLDIGNLHQNVTLIWNAVSDVHENVTLNPDKNNIGGWNIQRTNQTNPDTVIRAITLDDLTYLLKGKQVFIKMDIEESEWKALKGGHEFFKAVNASHVLMEFMWHRKKPSGKHICDFMTKNGYRPMLPAVSIRPLKDTEYTKWPNNVLWSKV